jgi:hypothetical protein
MITVSVSVTPGGAVLGVLLIGAGVALGIGAASTIQKHGDEISKRVKRLFGK